MPGKYSKEGGKSKTLSEWRGGGKIWKKIIKVGKTVFEKILR